MLTKIQDALNKIFANEFDLFELTMKSPTFWLGPYSKTFLDKKKDIILTPVPVAIVLRK